MIIAIPRSDSSAKDLKISLFSPQEKIRSDWTGNCLLRETNLFIGSIPRLRCAPGRDQPLAVAVFEKQHPARSMAVFRVVIEQQVLKTMYSMFRGPFSAVQILRLFLFSRYSRRCGVHFARLEICCVVSSVKLSIFMNFVGRVTLKQMQINSVPFP